MQRSWSLTCFGYALLALLGLSCGAALAQTGPGLGLSTDTSSDTTGDQWVPCIIHCHSRYSDGVDTVGTLARAAKAAGAKVLVVTDHAEDMELRTYRSPLVTVEGAAAFGVKQVGYAKYREECRTAWQETGIVVVPGVEVGIGNDWDPWREFGTDATRKIHLLGIGAMPPSAYSMLMTALEVDLSGKAYGGATKDLRVGQSMAAGLMHAYGLGVVIAHPWLSGGGPLWEKDDRYTFFRAPGQSIDGYSWDGAANIDAVEFFNGRDHESLRALNLVEKDDAGKGADRFGVTAGSDCHTLVGMGGRFADRITWVRLPAGALTGGWEAACQAVANGIKSGYTTAGVGALQPGETFDTWRRRVAGGNTAPQPQYRPFLHVPGRLIGRPEQWPTEGTTEPEPEPEPTSGGPTITNPKDPTMKLILIPAGPAIFGSSEADRYACENETPQFRASLPAYYIGETEVTNAQYKRFVDATRHEAPRHWDNGRIPPGLENHPVVYVIWKDAKAYCDWAGLRLPSELEWEKAARGTDGRIYPWGNEWDKARCVNPENHGRQGTAPVGSYPSGRSPYGLQDMAGNVFEWCADWYDWDAYRRYAAGGGLSPPASGSFRVLRGGGWYGYDDGVGKCRSAIRIGVNPVSWDDDRGFRVARNAGS